MSYGLNMYPEGIQVCKTSQWTIFNTPHTVNDKSFEGEKFRGLLGSLGMRGKVSWFFPSPPSHKSELSEEQKFSKENFRGLIKIRENRKSFLTVKLLSFTVLYLVCIYVCNGDSIPMCEL